MKIQVFDRRAITVASLSVLLVVGCVGAAFTWLYSRVVSVIDQDAVAGIQRDLTVTAAIYRDSGREGVIKALRPAMDSLPPGRVVALVDAQGKLLIGNHDAARVNFAVVGEQAVLNHPGGRIMIVTRRFADGSRVIVGQNDLRHGELARNLISAALAATVVALLALVAALDYLFQYRQWFERQKMSLEEVKEEYKQSEGDPHIKGRIRQLRHARMKKRMMAAVPSASVIITNPTHYSVALKYERGMSAPVCVAKGVDLMAFKIREIATAHNIPIVENVPLARALHATVEVDDEIPVEHYHAVAEVIGYVMRLRRAGLN